ncbi:hypothetical protein BC792_10831 [Sphingobacterium allocomposti]|jgi:hypothetical protein|uniref:Beta-ketoacyl synthase-like protein n=2 Tax=Sphingobacterium allocomposti TaxID=415956 RepID=A0A5S5DJ09_9SPHI|nr:hypothetical protein BC792_10831 [Sphingobacterium composti Yoo et al. 2007 non Ten et al. 2007]
MTDNMYIERSCRISENTIWLDGAPYWKGLPAASFIDFAKEAFRLLKVDYPKFYKMDNLSKLVFLAADFLLQQQDKDGIALVMANRSSSLDTDIKHQQSIQEKESFFPSPATFVYTLPNICEGELCIRHQLMTENIFLVDECFPTETIEMYAAYLLRSGKAKRVMCGWAELFQENYDAVLYLVGPNGEKEHTKKNIEDLFR